MKRIFLVEDDKEIAKNLTRLLNTEGFNVHIALHKERLSKCLLTTNLIWRW